ncbi:MAG: Zn-dependent hydrolase [Flavobacteriales bacterium]|nr:Zn-dependent hydrolase [Flavobacteriales bacterium]
MHKLFPVCFGLFILFSACGNTKKEPVSQEPSAAETGLQGYVEVELTADLSSLEDNYKKMIPLLIAAAREMDTLFWLQAYGMPDTFLNRLSSEAEKKYALINYGPWDRLNDNTPFLDGFGNKPEGAGFYPTDMTKEEFEQAALADKKSLYTVIRRDENGKLKTVPYSVFYASRLQKTADLLLKAAELSSDKGLTRYLTLRAEALLNDNYLPSDLAWMDMKTNPVDIVIGPIENYEDALFGYKAAFEAYVLIKDMEWSKKLEKFAAFLPELQQGLPVSAEYKREKPGTDADLNAYDVVYYAGDCNAGGKTIAINLPNDEEVQLSKGTRRLQLKNTMRYKFDKILVPIANELISKEQIKHITFDAFFSTVMFHEVAHGLGIKNTINGKGSVREALKEHYSALEEGKADILGLYMITQLHRKGEIEGSLDDYYVTFLAGIFRSVRFGAASAHGQANMIRFNYFKEKGAFVRGNDGRYLVDFVKMEDAMNSLSELILTLQGNGDYEGTDRLVKEKGDISAELQNDLDKLKEKNIPVDLIFKQGTQVLGL